VAALVERCVKRGLDEDALRYIASAVFNVGPHMAR